jgi:aspartate kinase
MSRGILVVKLGGDAVATPSRIGLAAVRLAEQHATHDLVVVTSARRGVTDHLLALTLAVQEATPVGGWSPPHCGVNGDRAVAAGEIVSAGLVALALGRVGLAADPLDAREAGILGSGPPGAARLRRVRTGPIRRRLAAGVVPVVAGFQVADRGLTRLLGRGGSDVTAVALAAALAADACVLFKHDGLRTGDPRTQRNTEPVLEGDYDTLDALVGNTSSVLHPDAARLARRHGVPLTFVPFPIPGPTSRIVPWHQQRAA